MLNPFDGTPKGRIFIKNVGANTSHPAYHRSQLFSDRTFEFLPIPEREGSPDVTTFGELRQFNKSRCKLIELSQLCASDRVHNDPEFENFTWGSGKGELKSLGVDDFLFFIARLEPEDREKATFALIGFLEVDYVLNSTCDPMINDPSFSNNEHVKRYWTYSTRGFTAFKGSENSRRFKKAVIFDREFVKDAGILDKNGDSWDWNRHPTDIVAIGCYTRKARMHIDSKYDPERAKRFWGKVWESRKE